jgi:hypothetical protein
VCVCVKRGPCACPAVRGARTHGIVDQDSDGAGLLLHERGGVEHGLRLGNVDGVRPQARTGALPLHRLRDPLGRLLNQVPQHNLRHVCTCAEVRERIGGWGSGDVSVFLSLCVCVPARACVRERTLAPRRASSRHSSRPMPPPAPVTRTVLPAMLLRGAPTAPVRQVSGHPVCARLAREGPCGARAYSGGTDGTARAPARSDRPTSS